MVKLRLSAYIAPYLEAIKTARAAGWRWADCRDALGLDCSDATFAQAVRRCKWQAEQVPLPAAASGIKAGGSGNSGNSGNSAKNPEKPELEPAKKPRPLPGQIPVGDGDEMTKALAEKGITFK